jgi:hypothetical protein
VNTVCGCFDPGRRASGSPFSLRRRGWRCARFEDCSPTGGRSLVGVLAPVAGEKDLAERRKVKALRRAQACLQGLTLGVAQWTHEDWSFHAMENNPQLPSCLGMH